jgi:8-oxo-dGTP diphosphatase
MLNEQTQVINVIFLCEYLSGEAIIASPDEVAGIFWLNHDEIIHHPLAPMWLIDNIKQVEQIRLKNGG